GVEPEGFADAAVVVQPLGGRQFRQVSINDNPLHEGRRAVVQNGQVAHVTLPPSDALHESGKSSGRTRTPASSCPSRGRSRLSPRNPPSRFCRSARGAAPPPHTRVLSPAAGTRRAGGRTRRRSLLRS